jgi:hypothetical protein
VESSRDLLKFGPRGGAHHCYSGLNRHELPEPDCSGPRRRTEVTRYQVSLPEQAVFIGERAELIEFHVDVCA